MKKIFVLSLLLPLSVGCTQPITNWQQPGVSQEQWLEDRSYCNTWARQQAEEDYAERTEIQPMDDTERGFRHFMRGYDTKLSQQSLMESCLRRRGYTPATEKSE